MFKGLVSQGERVAALMIVRHGVEGAAVWVVDTDSNRQSGDMRLRPGGPAECIRRRFAPGSDELAECTPIRACGPSGRRFDEPAFQNLDLHAANLTDR